MTLPQHRRRSFAVLVSILALAGSLGCEPPPNPQQPGQRAGLRPGRPAAPAQVTAVPSQADFEIHLDRSAMATHRVDTGAVTEALSRFFEQYPYFSLSDLQDVKVGSADGRQVPLKQVATVEVWFAAARTELVVGAGR